ncbi:Crp/Fnr family transcriptional regulator [uncultured Mucilaginibacter sp.]|uniref:Crp/Fnr family transcriptional regulator n=1 Tax=uncultured Mucilaginibacter sp. TaxID=797541 RepID=UPI0025CFA4F3|nr:Crp/Fnr family transcriptional regulator [uncultured Mucilaginibacter sp.]
MHTSSNITQPDIECLLEVFNGVQAFDRQAFEAMLPHWQVVNCKRKLNLTIEGDTERYLYVVSEGVQRCYCNYQGKETTIVFFYPGSFGGVVDSYLLQRASTMNFETLTSSRLLRISNTHFMQVTEQYPQVERWLRILLSHTLAGVLERQKELSVYSATDKLNALFKRSAFIFNLVPHKYLASYIGVDPATFSKLLGKMDEVKNNGIGQDF